MQQYQTNYDLPATYSTPQYGAYAAPLPQSLSGTAQAGAANQANALAQLQQIASMRGGEGSPSRVIRDLIREQLVGVLGERMHEPSGVQMPGTDFLNGTAGVAGKKNAISDTEHALTHQLANEALDALFRQEGLRQDGSQGGYQKQGYGYDPNGRDGRSNSKGKGGKSAKNSYNSDGRATNSYENGNNYYNKRDYNSGGSNYYGNGYDNRNSNKGYGKGKGKDQDRSPSKGGYGKDNGGKGYYNNYKGGKGKDGKNSHYNGEKGGKGDSDMKKRVRGTEKEAFHRRNLPGSSALEKLRQAINNFSNQSGNSAGGHGITNDVLAGNIREFSFDPDGVNFLVAALDQPDSRAALQTLFEEEILNTQMDQQVVEMAMDPFASCMLKSLLDLPQFHMKVYNKLKGSIFRCCCNEHGCRVIQKILEVGNDTSGNQMVEELKLNDKHPGGNDVLELVRNPNGNYVISKCLECLPPFNLQWVVESFKGEVCDMATRRYGSRVLQRIAEYCQPAQSSPVFDEMLVEEDTVLSLMLHPFGNYVMQNIVEHVRDHAILDRLFSLVRQHFLYMSQHKYASNIVEKSIGKMPSEENAGMVMTILKGDAKVNKTNLARGIGVDKNQQNLFNNGVNNKTQIANKDANFAKDENFHLVSLMNDRFGNYVVQKLLETCDDSSFAYRALASKVDEVESHPDLVASPYAKHILHKLRKGLYTNNPSENAGKKNSMPESEFDGEDFVGKTNDSEKDTQDTPSATVQPDE